jgi:hypothetical protein
MDERVLPEFARFFSHVEISDRADCWEWTGNKPDGRYGHFSVSGKAIKAHRWIYAALCGPVADGVVIRHKCDNPCCVNPSHLTAGTPADNVHDMHDRGRNADRRGEKHPLAKLTADDVIELRRLKAMGLTNRAIADKFGISVQQAGKIARRENWRHV